MVRHYILLLGCAVLIPFMAGCVGETAPQAVEAEPEDVVISEPAPIEVVQKAPKNVLGWVERVKIGDMEYAPKAKLDSGAKTSSIDADIIRQFERDGKDHVVFRVQLGEGEGNAEVFEAPIKRWVRIKRKGDGGDYIRRPVVEMSFCLGGERIVGEVNLAERGNFIYPVLIGRNMLADKILVDPSQTFVGKTVCE